MFRLVLLLIHLAALVQSQHSVWALASNRRFGANNGSPHHVTFGRVSLNAASSDDLCVTLLPECDDHATATATSELDTSHWVASTEKFHIGPREDRTLSNDGIRPAPLSRVARRTLRRRSNVDDTSRVARPASLRGRFKPKETEGLSGSDVTTADSGEIPPADVLEGVVKPLVPTDIWNRLTGREFDVPRALKTFSTSCINVATRHSNNQWVVWKPADKLTTKVEEGDMKELQALEEGDVLVYLGRFQSEGYGSQLPVVKTRSILPLSPLELAKLLMDSSRVQKYNHMSLGRTDVHVMQQGLDSSGGEYGDGEAKIVRNLTKPPLSKQKMEFVTMMHARPLCADDGVESGGYLVVSRAVGGDMWGGPSEEEESLTRNEILLGVNLIQPSPSGDPDSSLVTAVTHVYSPSVPVMLAAKVGVKGAKDFVKDIRKLYQPVPA